MDDTISMYLFGSSKKWLMSGSIKFHINTQLPDFFLPLIFQVHLMVTMYVSTSTFKGVPIKP